MGSVGLPLPEALESLAEGPAGSRCLLQLLAQKGRAFLLLAGGILLPPGIHAPADDSLHRLITKVHVTTNVYAARQCTIPSPGI